MNYLIVILIFVSILLTGCTEKERIVKVPTYKKINIPRNLLYTYQTPKSPKILSEEEISKYTLELYRRFKLNNSKKEQIQSMIIKHNKLTNTK